MRNIKIAGLALAVACAISAMTVASAGAALFNATAMGKLTAKVESGSTGEQRFVTAAGEVVCKEVHLLTGEAVLHSLTQTARVEYTNCKAFGLVVTKITPAEYEFNADGLARLVNALKIETEGLECTVTVPGNQDLLKVTYSTVGNSVLLAAKVHSIRSSGTGSFCTYAEESKGTYTGSTLVGLASGVGKVEWKNEI